MAERKTKVLFVSCIKIKGIHLLPPVITQKRLAELQGYKLQAIKLEKRLKNCRDLKKNLEDLLNMQSLTDRPHSDISFRDDNHVEALGITDKTNTMNFPLKTKALRKIKLSKDIIDVTQYNSDGIKIICNDAHCATLNQGHYINRNTKNIDANTSQQIGSLSSLRNNQDNNNSEDDDLNSMKLNKNNICDEKSPTICSSDNDSLKNISSTSEKSPRPRLIRSNSYTLDTPSPILLAHLQKTEKGNKYAEIKHLEDVRNLSISRNWSSLENNYIPFENSEFSSINTVYNTGFNDSDKDDVQSSTPNDIKELQNPELSSPAIKVIHTDISVQKITVDTNNEIVQDALNENFETSDSQLLQVLKTLPDIYAKQIIELIETQKLEKHKLTDYKEESQKNVNKSNVEMSKKADDPVNRNINNKNKDHRNTNIKNDYGSLAQNVSFSGTEKLQGSTTSISPSQSIYYSSTSSDTLRPLSNSSVRLIDFECDDTITCGEKSYSPKKTDITEYYVHEEIKKGMNVSRELFPQLDENTIHDIKKEWAASIIGAHVKGYLTRRLLKTERVQSLIETIKDALMCALQLHNAENIDESDVELHRRLINQVSAACYTFHDIFFAFTVQEQMLIIATDRQRKLEKAKRPASAPSARRSKPSSARSTPRQRVLSQSRSLTKV
ncbi:putative uncharacterized protein DDB_G0282499 [Anoplophora glabripennis]|uniref:putative uncharacterized protein DDB_G0282499 n=1 Tax=Anoplophora glabripennis TaxID=217634 RepID=UPI000874304B|nr:putative uncharacterized protein DDB_G0282499 [Anoplophora glabripennis]